MRHWELLSLIDAIARLEKAEPSALSFLLGAPLLPTEPPGRWQDHRLSSATKLLALATARLELATGYGLLRMVPHDPLPTRGELGVGVGSSDRLEVNPNIPPHGTTTFIRSQHFARVCYVFHGHSDALREIVFHWEAPRVEQGEEPVFQTAPELLYVPSYDSVHEVLEYAVGTKAWRVLSRNVFASFGRPEAYGAFARCVPAKSGAGELLCGVFATPEGPAFVAGSKRALAYQGKTEARIDSLPERRRRFSLLTGGRHQLEVIYEERHGVGTNPYDVAESDVDLFVAVQLGLKQEKWFAAFTRPWPA